MGARVEGIAAIYTALLEQHLDRLQRAYAKTAAGQYGASDWFRDLTETGTAVSDAVIGPWSELFRGERVLTITVEAGQTEVHEVFWIVDPGTTPLTNDTFDRAGETSINFTATLSTDRQHLIVDIDATELANLQAGAPYVGYVWKSGTTGPPWVAVLNLKRA